MPRLRVQDGHHVDDLRKERDSMQEVQDEVCKQSVKHEENLMFTFFVVYPLAVYGLYVLIGAPATDNIVALGRKAVAYIQAKAKE